MIHLIKTLSAPLLSLIPIMLCNGFFLTYLSVRLKAEGSSETLIGYVHSAYYAGLLLGAWKFEKLLFRIGHIRAFSAAAAIGTATILLQGVIISPYFWILMRFIFGVCIASILIVIESWLLTKSTSNHRGRTLSLYMFNLYFSLTLGQFIIDYVEIKTLSAFIIAGLLCTLSAVPLALTYADSPETDNHQMRNLLYLFRSSPFGVIGCFFGGMILSAIYSFVPNFAQTYHLSVSWVTSMTIAGGFILQWPIGHLSDIFDRHKLLIAVSAATMIPAILLVFLPKTLFLVCLISFILGGCTFTIYPISISHVCDRVQPEDITSTTGVLLLAYATGAIFGPLIAPLVMLFYSTQGLYLYIAACACLLALIGCYALWKKPSIPMEDQTEYVPLPNMTAVAYELDPRLLNEEEEQTTELR